MINNLYVSYEFLQHCSPPVISCSTYIFEVNFVSKDGGDCPARDHSLRWRFNIYKQENYWIFLMRCQDIFPPYQW